MYRSRYIPFIDADTLKTINKIVNSHQINGHFQGKYM